MKVNYIVNFLGARSEKRLLIIRNLQNEKTIIVNKQKEFYLSKEKILQIRKKFPANKEISFHFRSKTLPVYQQLSSHFADS
jgi:hypothetical protein